MYIEFSPRIPGRARRDSTRADTNFSARRNPGGGPYPDAAAHPAFANCNARSAVADALAHGFTNADSTSNIHPRAHCHSFTGGYRDRRSSTRLTHANAYRHSDTATDDRPRHVSRRRNNGVYRI